MENTIAAAAFRLGVKRSSILLPWERDPLKDVFQKKAKLISPPPFVPEPCDLDNGSEHTIFKPEIEGRLTWTRKASVIPWPVAQERDLSRALETWRIILLDNLDGSLLGRQIQSKLYGREDGPEVEQIIRDAFSGKATSTLKSRAASIMAFSRWKKSLDPETFIFPLTEEQAYRYVIELRQNNAPRTKATRFIEAVTFSFFLLGAEVGDTLYSARVKGAAICPAVLPGKKDPLTADQVVALENLATYGTGQEAVFAGYVCMILHCRLRWSDGQFCQYEPKLDLFHGRGFLECCLYHHKNAGRQRHALRLLPAACVIPGLSGEDWATVWLAKRASYGLIAGPGKPTMPAPLAGGAWSSLPLESSQATLWLREIIGDVSPLVPRSQIATHSLKATILSWLAKAGIDERLRRLAGYHVDPSSKMALEYSRDAQAPVLHAIEGVVTAMQQHYFDPDVSRAQRWKVPGCRSIQQAMEDIAKDRRGPLTHLVDDASVAGERPSPSFAAGDAYEEDSVDTISSVSDVELRPEFANKCDTSDEEMEAEVAGPIVGHSMASAFVDSEPTVVVFKHLRSGCCHIAKDDDCDDDDGEAVVLKCGKIATKNFERVQLVCNFLPYKCSRCFSDD